MRALKPLPPHDDSSRTASQHDQLFRHNQQLLTWAQDNATRATEVNGFNFAGPSQLAEIMAINANTNKGFEKGMSPDEVLQACLTVRPPQAP